MLDGNSFNKMKNKENPIKNEHRSDRKIEQAEKSDIEEILGVQEQHLIDHEILHGKDIPSETVKKYSSSGFLVYSFTSEELSDIIDNENVMLLVEKNNNQVSAYVAVYDLQEWLKQKPDWYEKIDFNNDEVKSFITENKMTYLRHAARRTNVDSDMYSLVQDLLNKSQKRGAKGCVGEILKKPIPNKISKEFFTKSAGFEDAGDISDGNLLWDLVLKRIDK